MCHLLWVSHLAHNIKLKLLVAMIFHSHASVKLRVLMLSFQQLPFILVKCSLEATLTVS